MQGGTQQLLPRWPCGWQPAPFLEAGCSLSSSRKAGHSQTSTVPASTASQRSIVISFQDISRSKRARPGCALETQPRPWEATQQGGVPGPRMGRPWLPPTQCHPGDPAFVPGLSLPSPVEPQERRLQSWGAARSTWHRVGGLHQGVGCGTSHHTWRGDYSPSPTEGDTRQTPGSTGLQDQRDANDHLFPGEPAQWVNWETGRKEGPPPWPAHSGACPMLWGPGSLCL